MKRTARLGLPLAMLVAFLAPLALVQSPSSATPTSEFKDTVGVNKKITAYSTEAADPVTVAEVSFQGQAGTTRYVTSSVETYMTNSNPDPLLGAFLGVTCYGDGAQSTSAAQNPQRGTSTFYYPRQVIKLTQTGTYTCRLTASGNRPDPQTGNGDTGSYYTVQSGSFLSVSSVIPSWSEQFTVPSGDLSVVLKNANQTVNPIGNQTVTLGSGTTGFDLISDHKFTVCSSGGGSDDNDGRGNLCTPDIVVPNSTGNVRIDTKVRQYATASTWCDAGTTYSEAVAVNRNRHHVMSYNKYRISVNPNCSNRFAISATVTLTSGTAVVVHYRSERLMVMP